MLGELLLLVVADGPGGSLQASFGQVICPDRVVEVEVVNGGGIDAFYELRVDDTVLRTEFIAAGMRLDSRVVLSADGTPMRVSVRDGQGTEIGAAVRTANCGAAAAEGGTRDGGAGPGAEGGGKGASASPTAAPGEAAPGPAAPGTAPAPGAPGAEGAVPGGGAVPGETGEPAQQAEGDVAPGVPTPKNGPGSTLGRGEQGGPGKSGAGKSGRPGKAGKSGKPGKRRPMTELPRTGMDGRAMGGAAVSVLFGGGVLLWYGRLWPRRCARPCAPGAPRRPNPSA